MEEIIEIKLFVKKNFQFGFSKAIKSFQVDNWNTRGVYYVWTFPAAQNSTELQEFGKINPKKTTKGQTLFNLYLNNSQQLTIFKRKKKKINSNRLNNTKLKAKKLIPNMATNQKMSKFVPKNSAEKVK